MSRSVINTANANNQTVGIGGIISPGGVVRRYGCNCQLSGNAITITGTGYYDISASITLTPSAAGTVTVTAYQDGVPLQGATASETVAAVDSTVNLTVIGMARLINPNAGSNITLVLTGVESDIVNVAEKVIKT